MIMHSRHSCVAFLAMFSCTLTLLALTMLHQEASFMMEWQLMSINSVTMNAAVMIDPTSTFFAATVSFISFNIFIFSKTYMKGDMNETRFLYLLMMFVMSMIVLIFTPNLIILMLGWDGLGITSFLLVIYYQDPNSLKSGLVTALTNRIGDCLLLATIAMMLSQGQWNIPNSWSEAMAHPTLVGYMIMLAAITKSAQLPFTVWLPAAMAAPTPVSALVHSSTLVTAGVYLIMRFYSFLATIPSFNYCLMLISASTLLLSTMWAVVELDLKKVIALSTMAQIALMMLSLSLGMVQLAFFHLVTHAMFKSLLFMAVGVAILNRNHMQNMQNLEGDSYITSIGFPAAVSVMAMNAFFFLSGYYSKEMIFESTIYYPSVLLTMLILVMATAGTATYSIRILRVLTNSALHVYPDASLTSGYPVYPLSAKNDSNSSLRTPAFWLTLGTLAMGSIAAWAFLTPTQAVFTPPSHHWLPLFSSLLGAQIALGSCAAQHKLVSATLFEYGQIKPPSVYVKLSLTAKAMSTSMLKQTYILVKSKLSQTFFGESPPNPFYNDLDENRQLWTISKRFDPKQQTRVFGPDYLMQWATDEEHLRDLQDMMSGMRQLTYGPVPIVMTLSTKIYKLLDQGWYETLAPENLKNMVMLAAKKVAAMEMKTITSIILMTLLAMTTMYFSAELSMKIIMNTFNHFN